MKKPVKCLNPSCQRSAHTRGLCNSCYTVALRLVSKAKVTWDELERAGKAKPSAGYLTGTEAWFLG